jgi:hypothetical protein
MRWDPCFVLECHLIVSHFSRVSQAQTYLYVDRGSLLVAYWFDFSRSLGEKRS